MTKREEALNKIWSVVETFNDANDGEIITKELETAFDIVHKAIRNYGKYKKYRKPMNVVRNGLYGTNAYCPRCGEYAGNAFTDFCHYCGQALAWGDE